MPLLIAIVFGVIVGTLVHFGCYAIAAGICGTLLMLISFSIWMRN